MEDLLQEIRFIPGVIGSFAYREKQGVTASDLPERYAEGALRQAGRVVNRLFHVRGVVCMGIDTVDIAFDDVSLSARKVRDDAAFVTLGDATVNSEFIAMTVESMLGEIEGALSSAKGAAAVGPGSPATDPPPAEPVAAPEPPPSAPSAPAPVRISDSEIEQLGRCLAGALGPIASVILRDTLSAWRNDGGASVQELVERLASEVDEGASRDDFRRKARGVLASRAAGAETQGGPSAPAAASDGAQARGLPESTRNALATALAKTVGPVSRIILEDALAEWKRNGPDSASRMPELMEILCREIGDSKAAEAFRREMG